MPDDAREQILILVTGGTFDKEYGEIAGKVYFKDSHVNEILSLGRCNLAVATASP